MAGALAEMKVAILVTNGFEQSEMTDPKKLWNKPAPKRSLFHRLESKCEDGSIRSGATAFQSMWR